MANIINTLDRADARVTNWLDDKYPTFIYRFIVGLFTFALLTGVFAITKAYITRNAFDLFFGIVLTVGSAIGGTLATLWARNEIASLRDKGRREHPSYPYKRK